MPDEPTSPIDAPCSGDLERLAARIADDEPVNWAAVGASDAPSLNGLREIEQLAQGFRHLQASAVAPQMPQAARFRFGALQVIEPLGGGAHGEVWRAYDPLLDLQVALKLRKSGSDALSHQFLDEARRLARVRQANIVSIYGAAVHEGRAGLWTELVRGSALCELLQQHGPFPVEEVRGIGLDLCHALGAVHRHGLVHGDVKAENVMREVSGRIVLMDFGAARELEHADPGIVSGTLRYLAPEVLGGAAPSPASDLYALGVLLFHLLTGAYPYAAASFDELVAAHQRGQRVPLRGARPDVPAALRRAIDRALDENPARRQASAMAFAATLAAAPRRAAPAGRMAAACIAAAVIALAFVWLRPAPASWQAQATMQRVTADGAVALGDGAALALGDRVVLAFQSSQAAYVYVFDDDGSGSTGVLFPLAGVEPANPLAANERYRLPGRKDGASIAWTVSSRAAREEFVVVASTAVQPELEQAIAGWQHASAAHAAARGAMGLAFAPDDAEIASAPVRAILQRIEHDDRVRHWRFEFAHAAP